MALIIVLAERPNASVLVIVMFFAKGNILPLERAVCVSLANASFDFVVGPRGPRSPGDETRESQNN